MRSRPTYWDKVRKELRPKFAAAGLLEICELGWKGCKANKNGIVPKQFQTFAHSLRRRKIDKYKKNDLDIYEEKMRHVIRCCTECHHKLDNNFEHEETERIVIETINTRKKPV